jgi:hypothetical protein
MALWIKLDVNTAKDAVIAELTDTQFRAFIYTIAEAKQLRNGGVFKSVAHLKHCLGPRLGRAVDNLVDKGLLAVCEGGVVKVSNYSRYQVDPLSGKRQQTWRARNRGGITETDALEGEGEKKEKENPLYLPKKTFDSTRTGTPTSVSDIILRRKA